MNQTELMSDAAKDKGMDLFSVCLWATACRITCDQEWPLAAASDLCYFPFAFLKDLHSCNWVTH